MATKEMDAAVARSYEMIGAKDLAISSRNDVRHIWTQWSRVSWALSFMDAMRCHYRRRDLERKRSGEEISEGYSEDECEEDEDEREETDESGDEDEE